MKTFQETLFDSLERQLAADRRRVVSDWRTLVLLSRALKSTSAEERRWTVAPTDIAEARTLLHRLANSGKLTAYGSYPNLYKVNSPYAQQNPIEEDEILMELHPYAALSHLSALVFHQLTDLFSKEIHVSIPSSRSPSPLPVGTRQGEWSTIMPPVRGHSAVAIEGVPIRWHRLDKYFGFSEYSPRGYPIRVMTLEKTLIDGLANPEWCGGLTTVLEAWVRAKDALKVKTVLKLTERSDVGVLRQRVGYVLEELGFSDPELDGWRVSAKRGGSSKLLASAPFVSEFSKRWMISINASTDVLRQAQND